MTTSDRRSFLKKSATTVASAALLPGMLAARPLEWEFGDFQDNEAYWEIVKGQFAIPDNLIMANSANLCSAPHKVNEKVRSFIREMNRDVSFQNRAVFADLRKETINRLASYLGTDAAEIGITRNTTESNNIIVNGLELSKGDEVVIWDQNHPSNRESWENKAKRIGFTVKRISTPEQPASSAELVRVFEEAITEKTRLVSFSHISNVTGIALPAKEICQMAGNRGVLTLIDGAQACGFLDLDLHDIKCDFYSTSTHKWMLGPLENGILYIKKEHIRNVWPDSITVFWNEEKDTVDDRFCSLGQRNETTPPAIIDALDFHERIGKKNIEQRIRQLAAYLKTEIAEKIRGVEFVTPIEEEMSGGVVIFKLPGKDPREVFEKLYTDYGIACAPTGGIRLSPTISATINDIDSIVDALTRLS